MFKFQILRTLFFTAFFLYFNFNAFCDVISVADNQTYIIDENSSLNVERIEMGANSTLINSGEITISSLDLSYCYNSGASFINNGTIYCNSIAMDINQWNWLPNMFTFSNNGNIICSGDIYFRLSARTNFSLGENSIIVCENLSVDKYGNQDIELLGIISSTDITIKSNDGGRVVRLGDIITENLTFVNNATNVTVSGMAYIENLNSSTWGSSNITIDGGMILGNIDNNSKVKGSADSFISLCVNPTSEKDFELTSNGTVCYRVKYSADDLHYWSETPLQENDVTGNAICKGNYVSYEQCIEGKTNFLAIETLSQEKGVIYQENKENVSESLKMIKYGRFEFYIKDDKLIYIKNRE